MKRIALVAFAAVGFAGGLFADVIVFWKGSGSSRQSDAARDVSVTAWNAKSVSYKAGDKTGSVAVADLISLDRSGGTKSQDLADALDLLGSDPAAGMDALAGIVAKGNELDKEEAQYLRAQTCFNAAADQSNMLAQAIAEHDAYVKKYKAGYFARDMYTQLADLQYRARKDADARATLKAMAGADPVLARLGHQKLGELECRAGQWKAAIPAFKSANSAAGDDKTGKYVAMAWEGMATMKAGDAAAAKTLLELVTSDEGFDDESTTEDEAALAVAYPALGDAHFASGNFQKAYDSFVLAGYYQWWNGGNQEGYCLAQAYLCAKKLESTDEKWKQRADKLQQILAAGYPRELQRVSQAGSQPKDPPKDPPKKPDDQSGGATQDPNKK